MKIVGDNAKPLKVNPAVSEKVAVELETEQAKRAVERQQRLERQRQRILRTWQLLAICTIVLTVLLPVLGTFFAAMGGAFVGSKVLVTCLAVITPLSDFWRRRFNITYGQMAAATGGGAFLAALINIVSLWFE